MSLGLLASRVIEANTHGDIINHRGVARDFGCKFTDTPFSDSTRKGTLTQNATVGCFGTFQFNQFNSEAENNTIMALLVAQQLLNISKDLVRDANCDVFFMREMRNNRMSAQIMLATRLAIPERMIAKISDIRFNSMGYARKSKLVPEFVNSAFHVEDGKGFFNMLNSVSLGTSLSITRHTLPETLHQYLWDPDSTPMVTTEEVTETPL